MIAVLLLVHLVGTISANTEDKAIQFDEVVVEPDDTLWGIAQKYRPNEDPRRVVWYIKKINQCGSTIYPGQTVKIPVL
jgi:nucleoid-associated protein YgaU